jgi:hypothetical protein
MTTRNTSHRTRSFTPLYAIDHAIGREAVNRLIACFGGARFDIPIRAEGHRFVAVIGLAAMATLCARFRKTTIELPLHERKRSLKANILDAIADDPAIASARLARQHGCTARYVRQLRRELGLSPGGRSLGALSPAPPSKETLP